MIYIDIKGWGGDVVSYNQEILFHRTIFGAVGAIVEQNPCQTVKKIKKIRLHPTRVPPANLPKPP